MSLPRYDGAEESKAYLKLMLDNLGKNSLPPNIVNMHLFYEYVSNQNKELVSEIDDFIKNDKKITEDTALKIYKNYIWDHEKRTNVELSKALKGYFSNLTASIKNIQNDNKDSQQNIIGHCESLKDVDVPAEISGLISGIVSETQKVIDSNSRFEKELEKKQEELDEIKKELEETKEQVDIDPLTNLKNRRFFETTIGNEIYLARNKQNSLSLIYLDIDHFKNVNDTHGHLVGDKVICFVSKTMEDVVEDRGVVARMGGEEFAILLPNTGFEIAEKVAEVIRSKIEKTNLKITNIKNKKEICQLNITISIGVTKYNCGEKVTSFLDRADKALYESKKTGRNKITTFN